MSEKEKSDKLTGLGALFGESNRIDDVDELTGLGLLFGEDPPNPSPDPDTRKPKGKTRPKAGTGRKATGTPPPKGLPKGFTPLRPAQRRGTPAKEPKGEEPRGATLQVFVQEASRSRATPGEASRRASRNQGFTPLRPIYHRSTPAIAYSSSPLRIQRFSRCLQVLSRGLRPYELLIEVLPPRCFHEKAMRRYPYYSRKFAFLQPHLFTSSLFTSSMEYLLMITKSREMFKRREESMTRGTREEKNTSSLTKNNSKVGI